MTTGKSLKDWQKDAAFDHRAEIRMHVGSSDSKLARWTAVYYLMAVPSRNQEWSGMQRFYQGAMLASRFSHFHTAKLTRHIHRYGQCDLVTLYLIIY